MKTVAIHQPHYFPWLGYLDKMAKANEFVVLDEVQFADGSPMSRNRFLQVDGKAKLLSLSIEKRVISRNRPRTCGYPTGRKPERSIAASSNAITVRLPISTRRCLLWRKCSKQITRPFSISIWRASGCFDRHTTLRPLW